MLADAAKFSILKKDITDSMDMLTAMQQTTGQCISKEHNLKIKLRI
jgi:hypothetical protein